MGKVIAAYGGGFKPPTAGHFEIVDTALEKYPEILRLPLIITKLDLEVEKSYLEYYDEEYWKNYRKRKMKSRINKYDYETIIKNIKLEL